MKRLFRAALVAAILPVGLLSVGCAHGSGSACGGGDCGGGGGVGGGYANRQDHHGKWYDISWPDRYNYAARQAVVAPFAQQAANGHFLHQTMWNFYFEPGSDKLTPGGMEKLNSLSHATPGPDPRIYVQNAQDIGTTAENMDKVAGMRNDLNAKRAAAVQKYMATTFGPPITYEVLVHDAPTPGISGVFAGNAYRGQGIGYRGGLSAGGIGVGSVGGGSGQGLPVGNANTSSTSTSTNTNVQTGAAPAP
jgi:hypothetical protein